MNRTAAPIRNGIGFGAIYPGKLQPFSSFRWRISCARSRYEAVDLRERLRSGRDGDADDSELIASFRSAGSGDCVKAKPRSFSCAH